MRNQILSLFVALTVVFVATQSQEVSTNPAYVCSFCLVLFGLVEESIYQVHLQTLLQSKCASDACRKAVEHVILQAEAGRVPEDICRNVQLCTDTCVLFPVWPVNPIPDKQPEWPVERRLAEEGNSIDYTELKHILTEFVENAIPNTPEAHERMPAMGVISAALAQARGLKLDTDYEPCKHNVSCHIINFVDGHLPLKDFDGDRFAPLEAKRLRGSDWRGADCDDKRRDVYPGRKVTVHDDSVDHNCNGIYGGNSTGSYEDLFCKGTQQRGLIMLGDSATAHFHIPPQWLTANGWNMNQLLEDAENELDKPMCSWGTGHVKPEDCPYMNPVPGVENEIISLYTQLRNRNRCNHNDFQNIGVNGARITSSMKLVDSMGRDQTVDQPALVWLALIGNDVCNGHPGFDHMTTPDDFYTHAMETLNAIDTIVPKGSHVVALALFDGELLYDTMHALQHPVGTTYEAFYDLMNCEEENPCWGWLNSDRVVRANTTKISNSLNDVYQNISDTATFKNFEFIFYSPNWAVLFSDYAAAGYPLSNLIEPSDGFHPSQAGNALFAQKFFEWLETEHPEALGPVNPHNDEIAALFPDQF